jgi:signal transduction histidine kinase
LRIEDSGPGIDPDLVPRLFDPFARGANVGAVSGTGLGLAVCRAIVSLHAGTVDIEPIERRSVTAQPVLGGAVFLVRLPIHALTTEKL